MRLCDLSPAHIRAISPYQPGKPIAELAREMGLAESSIVKLASNENPLGFGDKARAAMAAALDDLARYPDGNGFELKQALCRRYGVAMDEIVLGNGSNDVLELAARAFLGPQTSAIYAQHAFAVYPLATQAVGARGVEVPARHFGHDLDAMLAAITPDTRVLFIANPNNPTGSYLPVTELQRLRAGLPDDVILVIDAAYAEYADAVDYTSGLEMARSTPNTVSMRTFSKLHGLAALRLGWMTAGPGIVDVMHRVRGPFNVSLPAQAAGVAALDDVEHAELARAHNARWLPWLSREITALGLRVHPSQGNFILIEFPAGAGRDAAAANAHLEAEGIIPRQMGGYGLPNCLRISVGLEDENRRLVEALAGFYLPEGFKDIAAYVVVLVMLVVKPNGLFGGSARKKV